VLWDLAQNQYIVESAKLAESVQRHMNELTGTRDRGVRQAPFRVLMGATMPAILVEVGFISNPDEEARFKDLDYRNRVVQALAAAIHDYLRDLQRLSAPGSRAAGAAGSP
jgi:N-acetylmuramoyl-L-alanine amidase